MLLRRNFPIFIAPGFLAAGLLSGCIIVGSGSSGSSNSSGGVGGGDVGNSGVGGEYEETTSAYGEGTGGTTASTASGGATCIGVDGTGKVTECDSMNISPKQGAQKCGPNYDQEPIGYTACKHAFQIYTTGAATDLLDCLSEIGVQNACDDAPVSACAQKMYDNICYDQVIVDDCVDLGKACEEVYKAGPLDQAQCKKELGPLNDANLMTLDACIKKTLETPGTTCQNAYNSCYDGLLF